MTICISISHNNPDADHAVVVTSEAGGEQRIEPGQTGLFHIYAGNDLRISEVALETAHEAATLQSFSLAAIGQGVTGDEPTEHVPAQATVHNLTTYDGLESQDVVGGLVTPPAVETVTYPDNTEATGVAPLPAESPVDSVAPHDESVSAADVAVMPADLAPVESPATTE